MTAAEQDARPRALLRAAEERSLAGITAVLAELGYDPCSPGESLSAPDLIIVVAGCEPLDPETCRATGFQPPPPVVVFGPAALGQWRRAALQAGAFACLSLEAPVEEKTALLLAAGRYRSAQLELELLRRESDVLFTNLLEACGEGAVELKAAVEERRRYQDELERIKNRIIRFIL